MRHFRLQKVCGYFISEISEIHHDFTFNYLINSGALSREGVISASKRVKLRSPERADCFLYFLRNHGFSVSQISKLVGSRSELLQFDPEKTLLAKLVFFRSFGVSREGLAATLSYNPKLLTTSLEKRIASTYDFLRSLLSQKNVVSVFKSGSWIFVEGQSKKVAPNIEVLRESGTPQSCISLLMLQSPGFFMLKPKDLGQLVDEIKQIGFNLLKSTSVETIRALRGNNRSICNRNRRVYKRWGWSEDDVLSALRRHPRCMTVGKEDNASTGLFSEKDGTA